MIHLPNLSSAKTHPHHWVHRLPHHPLDPSLPLYVGWISFPFKVDFDTYFISPGYKYRAKHDAWLICLRYYAPGGLSGAWTPISFPEKSLGFGKMEERMGERVRKKKKGRKRKGRRGRKEVGEEFTKFWPWGKHYHMHVSHWKLFVMEVLVTVFDFYKQWRTWIELNKYMVLSVQKWPGTHLQMRTLRQRFSNFPNTPPLDGEKGNQTQVFWDQVFSSYPTKKGVFGDFSFNWCATLLPEGFKALSMTLFSFKIPDFPIASSLQEQAQTRWLHLWSRPLDPCVEGAPLAVVKVATLRHWMGPMLIRSWTSKFGAVFPESLSELFPRWYWSIWSRPEGFPLKS